ncbi:ATP-binding cassette domain-containing protein [bacterium]|nr:ATP-binding cassette domain-containing protein [bacterium]
MNAEPVIDIEKVSFSYRAMPVLEDISMTVAAGSFLGIVGPNGGGKTTLLRLILGLIKPDRGTVRLFGKPPVETRRLAGYVPQSSMSDPTFPVTVGEVAAMGAMNDRTWGWRLSADTYKAGMDALREVSMEHLADVPFGELSGGQRQRCLIARALASHPRLLVLDEPTASIDNTTEEHLYELLKALTATMTILLVSHDIGVISSNVSHVACINRRLVCHAADELDTADIVRDAYAGNVTMLNHHCRL